MVDRKEDKKASCEAVALTLDQKCSSSCGDNEKCLVW